MEKVARRAALPSREAVVEAMDNCYDPCCRERRVSVVDIGLIESIGIDYPRHKDRDGPYNGMVSFRLSPA